jgi:heat shock protein HtpX
MKISSGMARIPKQDLRTAEGMNAFFIFPAAGKGIATLFSTHPPLEKRIEALQRIEGQLQGSAS